MNNNITEQDIIDCYAATNSLKKTAAECNVTMQVARRVLATAGIYASDLTEEINRLYNSGKSVSEIAQRLGTSVKAVHNHLPYSRKSYCVGEKTANAIRIANWRQNTCSTKSKQ